MDTKHEEKSNTHGLSPTASINFTISSNCSLDPTSPPRTVQIDV